MLPNFFTRLFKKVIAISSTPPVENVEDEVFFSNKNRVKYVLIEYNKEDDLFGLVHGSIADTKWLTREEFAEEMEEVEQTPEIIAWKEAVIKARNS